MSSSIRYILAICAVILLTIAQRPQDTDDGTALWRAQADAPALTLLHHLEQAKGSVTPKVRVTVFRWQNERMPLPVIDSSEVTLSNTSFMAGHRCVCVPLRL